MTQTAECCHTAGSRVRGRLKSNTQDDGHCQCTATREIKPSAGDQNAQYILDEAVREKNSCGLKYVEQSTCFRKIELKSPRNSPSGVSHALDLGYKVTISKIMPENMGFILISCEKKKTRI